MIKSISSLNNIVDSIELYESKGLQKNAGNLSRFLRTKAKVPYVVYRFKSGKTTYDLFFFKLEADKEGIHWSLNDGEYTFIKQDLSLKAMEIPSTRLALFLDKASELGLSEVEGESLRKADVFSGQHPVALIIRKYGKGVVDHEVLSRGSAREYRKLINKFFTDGGEPQDVEPQAQEKELVISPLAPINAPIAVDNSEAGVAVKAKRKRASSAKRASKALKKKSSKKGAVKEQGPKGATLPLIFAPKGDVDPEVKKKFIAKKVLSTGLGEDVVEYLYDLGLDTYPNEKLHKDIVVFRDVDPLSGPIISYRQKKGNKSQLRYSAQYNKMSSEAKERRVLGSVEPKYNEIEQLFSSNIEEKNEDLYPSVIGSIVHATGLRPGTKKQAMLSVDKRTSGISTLRKRDVSLNGSEVSLKFIGKARMENTAVFNDPLVAEELRLLMIGKEPNDFIFGQKSDAYVLRANQIIKELCGEGSLKDLRTIKAATMAREILEERKTLPKDVAKAKKALAEVFAKATIAVSKQLNNTPVMARDSYIPKSVLIEYIESRGQSAESLLSWNMNFGYGEYQKLLSEAYSRILGEGVEVTYEEQPYDIIDDDFNEDSGFVEQGLGFFQEDFVFNALESLGLINDEGILRGTEDE